MQQLFATADQQHSFAHFPHQVWRASEHARLPVSTARSQYSALDIWLPGGGWPQSTLIEILHEFAGCGELTLVAPALAAQASHKPIVLLNPPGVPNALAWRKWQIPEKSLWWVRADKRQDSWWCAETILRSRSFAALLAWVDPIDDTALRRLHACAQDSPMLIFLFRPRTVANEFSPSPLRLLLTAHQPGLASVQILKAKGCRPAQPLTVTLADHNALSIVRLSDVDCY